MLRLHVFLFFVSLEASRHQLVCVCVKVYHTLGYTCQKRNNIYIYCTYGRVHLRQNNQPKKQTNKQSKTKYNTVISRRPKPHINISDTVAGASILHCTSNSNEPLFLFSFFFLAIKSELKKSYVM